MTWLAELTAERVTHSRESHSELVERLMSEHPTSPRQVAIRRQIETDAYVRRQQRLIDEARSAQASFTPLERRLGDLRLQALMDELANVTPWNTIERTLAS